MKKIAASIAAAALLSGSIAVQPVMAKDKDGDRAAAVAGVIALGLLGAAVAQHQHGKGHEEYRHHPKLHADENAVGACMHPRQTPGQKSRWTPTPSSIGSTGSITEIMAAPSWYSMPLAITILATRRAKFAAL